ncbi:hypothetical protein D9756_001818 [Leucocoprinus leucothites]|uniref:Uncharacterized protein n=1 Tax=Leucocoprinus leucothites TaxID=201217 RepID=A0A8H5LID4_9AGAR|nr:hypothetical protein D9756_001818 [Leucoagaricus leucothites]
MSSSFTPSDAIDMSSEKTWPSSLGLLDWDSTTPLNVDSRYTGTTVDPNFTTIAKLPRYAKFGKLSAEAPDAPSAQAAENTTVEGDAFRPSRRVRTAPGGGHTNIFGYEEEEDDALASAPPKRADADAHDATEKKAVGSVETQASEHKPSRRVRTHPGGKDSIGSLWDADDPEEFKPTRRVREGPGGQDHLTGFW